MKIFIATFFILACLATVSRANELDDAILAIDQGDFLDAERYLKNAADKGVIEAQYILGQMYFTGEHLPKDLSRAFFWAEKSGNQDYPPSQYMLGGMYKLGLGTDIDIDKSKYWYEKALTWYQSAAKQGDPEAQHLLGRSAYFGSMLPQDPEISFKWFKLAAEQGHPESIKELAMLYWHGLGTEPNRFKALEWFETIAVLGDIDAQYHMGVLNQYAPDSDIDLETAYKWYRIAELNGNTMGQIANIGIAKNLTSQQIKEAQKLAEDWNSTYN